MDKNLLNNPDDKFDILKNSNNDKLSETIILKKNFDKNYLTTNINSSIDNNISANIEQNLINNNLIKNDTNKCLTGSTMMGININNNNSNSNSNNINSDQQQCINNNNNFIINNFITKNNNNNNILGGICTVALKKNININKLKNKNLGLNNTIQQSSLPSSINGNKKLDIKSSSSSASSLIDNNNKQKQNEQIDNKLKRDSTQQQQQQELDDNRNKKKRCSDRYDSSESSDSGVATSLSCTDSSTASSDASDPGSPYSPVSLSDDVQLSKKSNNNNNNNNQNNNNNMPPSQTTLLTNNTKTSPSTANSTAINNKDQPQQQQQLDQQQKTTQNLWPWHKIQSNNINGNNTSNNVQSGTLNSIATAKINPIPQNSNKNLNKNKRLSPGNNNHNNNDNNNHITANKKSRLNNQNATITSTTITTNGGVAIQTDFVQKITKSTTTSINNKRLKLAANINEECQTKITGFFKSQMKQLNNNSMKKNDKNIKLSKSSTPLNNSHTTNSNDFDSLLNQNDGSINLLNQKNQFNSINNTVLNTVTTTTSTSAIKNYESTTNSLQNIFNQKQNNNTNNSPLTNNLSLVQLNNQIGTNLKKNDRNKNMKIAQVAPNLRKTTNSSIPTSTAALINKNNNNHLISNSTIGKSPKKHIAIAPRTFDIKPAKTIKPNPPALVPSLQQIQQDHTKLTGTTQPTVLLTAIRIPSQTTAQNNFDKNQTVSCKPINSLTTNQQQNCIVSSATNTTVTPTTNSNNVGGVGGNLYQIPMMPNLVQFPSNLLATNGANLLVNQNGQLSRISNATTAAQNFLYGTVIKLQQIAAANQSNNNNNNNSGLIGGSSGLGLNNLINSQNNNNNNGTNGLLQIDNHDNILVKSTNIGQGIVPLGNQQQQHQKHINAGLPLIQQQTSNLINQQFNNRLTAQQIIMATSTNGGYLLNATTMPAVFTNTKFIPQTMPALQPIQSSVTQQNSTILPSLTSILQNNQQNLQQTIKSQQKTIKQKSNLDTMYTNLLQQQELTKLGKNFIKQQQQQSPALLHFKSSTQSVLSSSTKQQMSKISSLVPPPLVTLAGYHDILKTITTSSTTPTLTTTGKTLLTRNTSSVIDKPAIGVLSSRKLINNNNDIPPLTSTTTAKNFNKTSTIFSSNEFVKKVTGESNGKTKINEINKVTSTTATVSIPPLLMQDVKDDIDLSVLPSVPKKLKILDKNIINNNVISSSLSSSLPDVFIDEGIKLDSLSNSSNSSSLSSALAEASSSISSGIISKILSPSSLSQLSINNDDEITQIKAAIQTTIIDKNDDDEEEDEEKNFVIEKQKKQLIKNDEIIELVQQNQTIKCAISPILSQPKTIRFPASGEISGTKGLKRHDGVCYWDDCNAKHDNSSKLLDHMQTIHVNTQTGPFACLWAGCKVHGKESCSRRWLERHVLSHGGTKQFKCIVDGCGLRFASQLALQKHVNGHFNATETKDNPSKRTSDPPVPKLLRKNGKKLRYRRQPFSARMFDFFDSGMMEGLQHRLKISGTIAAGAGDEIIFNGQPMARRTTSLGVKEVFVQWKPNNIINNEWVPECPTALTKFIKISNLSPQEKSNYDNYLSAANLHSDICTIFNDNKLNLLTTIKNKEFKNNNNLKLSSSSSFYTDDHQNQQQTDQNNKFQCNGSVRNCHRQYKTLNEKLFRKQSRKPPTQKLLLPS